MVAAALARATSLAGTRVAWSRAGAARSREIARGLARGPALAARALEPARRPNSLRSRAGSEGGPGGEGPASEKAQEAAPADGDGENAAVAAVAGFFGKAFYSPLWLGFLFLALLGFFGGYGYLIVTNAQDSNVPILLGPARP